MVEDILSSVTQFDGLFSSLCKTVTTISNLWPDEETVWFLAQLQLRSTYSLLRKSNNFLDFPPSRPAPKIKNSFARKARHV